MLEFQDVSIAYRNEMIIQNLSLTIPTGRITSIVGANGCGKTTLVSSLVASSDLKAGKILLDGTDISKISSKERACMIAYLPQIRHIIPALPVRTLVEHGRFPHLGFARKKTQHDIDIVNQAMAFTEITQYADQYADTLSGGIRQRVFFAMLLAQDCNTIVLDEPTTYLDIKGQRQFYDMLLKLREQGKTIVIVLHDISKALEISDKIVVMEKSKITFDGTVNECIESRTLEHTFDATLKILKDGDETYYIFK
jgi:iron complex transport system ATP-binding protein